MTKYTALSLCAALGAAAILGGCRNDSKASDTLALKNDSTLNKDLQLAGRDTAAQPQLKDVPAAAAPAPARQTSARRPERTRSETKAERREAAPPPPRTTASGNTETRSRAGNAGAAGGGAVGSIPAGATLGLTSNSKVCTNTNAVGDHITATVQDAVPGVNGAVIPSGAVVDLTITQLKRSENVRDPVVMEFAVNNVTFGGKTYPLDASVTAATVDRIRDEPTSKDVQKVAIGAAAGAVLGKIFGKSTKATVIGGAAGAAAGAGAAVATANYQGCIASGGSMTVKLNSAAQIRAQ